MQDKDHFRWHFNTALRLGAAALLLHAAVVRAQDAPAMSTSACAHFQRDASFDSSKPWWFLSYAAGSSKDEWLANTLPIVSAERMTLLQAGSHILTRIPAASALAADGRYVVVRATPVQPQRFHAVEGLMVRKIGTAHADQQAASSTAVDGVRTFSVVIDSAYNEITESDRLLSVACLSSPKSSLDGSSAPVDIHAAAKVTALLNHAFIGEQRALALMDQGQLQGVAVGQRWTLVDELPKNPLTAKPFGRVNVLQVFNASSLIEVEESKHELEVGSVLRFPTALLADKP